MRIRGDKVVLNPLIPTNWKTYSFHSRFRGILFEVRVNKDNVRIENLSGNTLDIVICDSEYKLQGAGKVLHNLK
jgi:maltose phosphorylase